MIAASTLSASVLPETHDESNYPLAFGASIPHSVFSSIERHLQLENCKWDTQVGDRQILLSQPLLLRREAWTLISEAAEALARETSEAEQQLLGRPDLQAIIGLPQALQRVLRPLSNQPVTQHQVRTLRFDFHFTTEGWRISELNSDVPGGFVESSVLPEMFAQHFPGATVAGNPLKIWVRTMHGAVGKGRVALLSAPGYLEDLQVVALLAEQLRANGNECALIQTPRQLSWRDGRAHLAGGHSASLDAVVRFYQAEWLCQLPGWVDWKNLFLPGETVVTNPAVGALSESKRLPLIWNRLSTSMSAYSRLLPRCVDPREIVPDARDSWVLKGAYSNTGDEVRVGALMTDEAWRRALGIAQKKHKKWVAQRRFHTVAVASAAGPLYPCVGVYTVNGKTAGAYVRLSAHEVIDHAAYETALLIN